MRYVFLYERDSGSFNKTGSHTAHLTVIVPKAEKSRKRRIYFFDFILKRF